MKVILFDCHMHTEFSADSNMKIEDALSVAEKLDIGIITTEHVDFDFPGGDLYEFDAGEYFDCYQKYRNNNNLLLGVEIGMQKQTAERSRTFVQSAPFDMVIISQHIVAGHDVYFPEYYEGKDKVTAYTLYLEMMAELINDHSFGNVLGHIDFICRKAPYEDNQLYYDEFAPYIDKIWQAALDNNIVPELNTRRFKDERDIKALLPVYNRYREMGGRYATIGSDAHNFHDVGYGVKRAVQFLQECDLSPVYFKDRQIITVP